MSLALRVYIAWFLLVGLGTVLFYKSIINQLPATMVQAAEEVLVDTSHLLAEVAALHWKEGFGPENAFGEALQRFRERPLQARIWSRQKTGTALTIYITDARGRVVFHSDPRWIGADFSNWRDVARTLRGEYGARTTPLVPGDPATAVMYVAAPIEGRNGLLGVVSVGQPTAGLEPFLSFASRHFWERSGWILLSALVLGGGLVFWQTRGIRQLAGYVDRLRSGGRGPAPRLGEPELDRLAQATSAMRAELDGKAYIEQYVHTLTHELKSPLSAIRGAAELLQEAGVDAESRQRFLANIDSESKRMQRLIDRLLSLAAIESRQQLAQVERCPLQALIDQERLAKQSLIARKRLDLSIQVSPGLTVEGERFLLEQAISNILDNAIEFTPEGGQIRINAANQDHEHIRLRVENDGEPIPDYALSRVFDRFYSLPRPDSQRKSTGLGLGLVREVAQLHQGEVRISNIGDSAVQVDLDLPVNQSGHQPLPVTSGAPVPVPGPHA